MESSSRFYTDLGFARLEKAIATIYVVEPNGPAVLLPPTVVGYSFSFDLVKSPSAYCYITLTVTDYSIDGIVHSMDSRDVTLIAVFKGSDVGATISLRSTIANAYAFAQMLRFNNDGRKVTLAGTERALRIAFGMRENLAVTTGAVSHVISRPPNGLETNSYAMFNTLSSLVYYNITDAAFYKSFLGFTSANSFLEGLLNLVWNPFTNAQEIYNLVAGKAAIYEPSLPSLKLPPHKSPVPNQWTLTIKVNDSGARNFLMAGLAYVVFDKEDKAWISNNFRQGSAFSGTHCIVLNADGTPCGFSPIMGGGILGPGFGAAVDPSGETIAFGNFGWGPELFNPQSGSVSMFSYKGEALSPPNGFTQYLSRVQGMCYDSNGHLWMASVGSQEPFAPDTPTGVYPFESANSALVVYLHGNPQLALSFSNFLGAPSPYHNTFDVTIDKEGNAIVSNIGDKDKGVPSSVHKIKLDGERLVCLASWVSDYENPRTGLTGYEELRQVVVNKKNEVLVVGITSSRVVKLCPDLKKITTYTKNIYAPWGITLDGAGTMFIANFAQEKGRETSIDTWDMQGPYGVTVIRNEDEETAALMTLPTGGDEVTLRNGHPLYGTMEVNGQSVQWPSYEPIMRLTSTGIDAAGNVWAVNNWKPSAAVDVLTNPGGDGVVIFVGAAKPVSSP